MLTAMDPTHARRTGEFDSGVDADMVRMLFVSLAMTPVLLRNVFEEQMEHKMDDAFLERLAQLSARLFVAGLTSEKSLNGQESAHAQLSQK